MSWFGRKDSLETRVTHLEGELRDLKREMVDLDDTVAHRFGRLMQRLKRATPETLAPEAREPNEPAPPIPNHTPALIAARRRMRGF